MKKNITFLVLSLLSYSILFGQACDGTLTATTTSVCVGDPVTLTIEPTTASLETTLAAGNQQNGNMFDVTAFNEVVITGFDVSPNTTTDYEIYYKVGTYLGFEGTSSAWTLLGSSTGIGPGTAIDAGIVLSQTIPAGQTYSYYVTSSIASEFQAYTTGNDESADIANDGNIRITEGIGIEYPFGTTYRPRIFNGRVKYHLSQTFLWSDGSTGTSLTKSPSESTLYSVETTCSNGSSFTKTLDVTASTAVVDITATEPNTCNGTSTTLSAVTTVNTSISTAFDSNNGSDGNMFDIVAKKDLTIKGLDISYTGTIAADYEIYGKTGTHVGFEGDASSWTLLGSATLTQAGDAIPLPINLSITLAQNDAYAIYVSQQAGTTNLHRYTNGNNVGDPLVEDANLRLLEGIALEYPFGTVYSPRNFNGRIRYEAKSSANLTWNTGAIAGSIIVTPTATTTYSVTSISNVASCPSTDDITIGFCVGIEDLYENYAVNLFPNPSSGFLNLTIDGLQNKAVNMIITNLHGQVMMEQNLENVSYGYNQQLDLSSYANGLYFVRLMLEGETSIHKFNLIN